MATMGGKRTLASALNSEEMMGSIEPQRCAADAFFGKAQGQQDRRANDGGGMDRSAARNIVGSDGSN